MRLRGVLNTALMVVLILLFQVNDAYSQGGSSLQEGRLKSYKVVSQETYNRVLDILFPQDDSSMVTIVLRFEPSFQPESQIVIKRGLNKAEVIEYSSLSGNIYSKLNNVMARGGKEDAIEMAKLIKVRRRSMEVPYARVKRWHADFLDSVSESMNAFKEKLDEYDTGTSTTALDGTFYDLWYKHISNEMSFRVYDQAIEVPRLVADLKLVQWMNAVRQEVGRLK
jgi:hypothetical protein